jgi:hypothetical protein
LKDRKGMNSGEENEITMGWREEDEQTKEALA